MDIATSSEAGPGSDDLSALAWVHGELRRSLENAHKALRRYLKEADTASASDIDAVDPAVLRAARTQLHQGVGALELVGMPAVADVLRASESAVQRLIGKPALLDVAAVEAIEKASFALLDFIGRQLAGKPVSPVMLFPQYRAVQQIAGADRVHPADLWKIDWVWQELPADASAQAINADEEARSRMEGLVLALMRQPSHAAGPEPVGGPQQQMSDLCADLGAGARFATDAPSSPTGVPHQATFWQLAAAVYEAQSQGLLEPDLFNKRLASRLLAQLRARVRGDAEVSDRLAQDLLFFCLHAKAPALQAAAPRLSAVRRAWRSESLPATADYDTPRLGRHDPALLALARKRVAAARDTWSAVAGGELHRLSGLGEQFTLVGESLQRLVPGGDQLAQALQTAAQLTLAVQAAPDPALAMEVATAILYLDATLEDGELDHPDLQARVQRLALRVEDVRGGAEPQPLDGWMEELYRRVSDRQTMGSVVAELRASLSEVEKQIDSYFRDPTQRHVLIPVPAQLSAMRGVLSVLGLTQASQAALHMRDDVDALAQTEVDPHRAVQTGTFDRLADNLGALSFLIDMLAVQPALAKSLFRFDPETGSLSAVMGQSERVSAFAAFDETVPEGRDTVVSTEAAPLLDRLRVLAEHAALPGVADDELAIQLEPLAQQALAADQSELSRLLAGAARSLKGGSDAQVRGAVRAELIEAVSALAPAPVPVAAPAAPVPPPKANVAPGDTGLEDDAEMREIFIEEAREVVADAHAALARLADAPDNTGDLTAVRRAFHTLKGSSRMVGLKDFGEAAWACEQLYNERLAQSARMDKPLRQLSSEALIYLAGWTDAIADGQARGHQTAAVAQAADAMRLEGRRVPIVLPGMTAVDAAAELDEAQALPTLLPAAPAMAPEAVADAEDVSALLSGTTIEPEVPAVALVAPSMELVFEPLEEPTPEGAEGAEAALAAADVESAAAGVEPTTVPEVTLPLPVLEPEAAVQPAADAAADFALDLDFEAAPAAAPAEPLAEPSAEPLVADDTPLLATESASLAERVPDLPSAADLDLGAPAPAQPAKVLDFDFDLGDGEAPADATAQPSLPPQVPGLPAPLPAGWADEPVLELDAAAEPDALLDLPLDAPAPAPAPADALPLPFEESLVLDLGEALGEEPAADLALPLVQEPEQPLREAETETASVAEAVQAAEIVDLAELAGGAFVVEDAAVPHPAAAEDTPPPEVQALSAAIADEEEQVKVIGHLRIGIPLFNIYLNEADELSRRLGTELAEWSLEADRHPVPESTVALAHSLAGNSATVGFADLSALARALEHALERSHQVGVGRAGEPALFNDSAEEVRRLLHQFAAGFLRPVAPALMERLAEHERLPVPNAELDGAARAGAELLDEDLGDIDAVDAIDADLLPIFEEEADELLPQLQARLRDWHDRPADPAGPSACMRTLHTLKGGARLAGAMRLGEMAHRLETGIEALVARGDVGPADIDPLLMRADAMSAAFERLRHGAPAVPASIAQPEPTGTSFEAGLHADGIVEEAFVVDGHESVPAVRAERDSPEAAPAEGAGAVASDADAAAEATAPADFDPTAGPWPALDAGAVRDTIAAPLLADAAAARAAAMEPPAPPREIDWQRFAAKAAEATPAGLPLAGAGAGADRGATGPGSGAVVRVRAGLLDRLVNQAGEVSITRARMDSDVKSMQGSLNELTDSLERMRRQLRDIELQAETQISTRLEAAKAASASFDPLEMDRFTRFQELTRFMAESVNDVATLQRSLQRTLQSAEDELAAQARLTRELQDDLLRTRMVEFESLADRLYRTARQAARDTAKQVRLDIVGGAIEVDRGVLERMAGPFEHLLRNSVAHGVELPALRQKAGKDGTGTLTVTVAQAGNEVAVEFADDGAGLDLPRIRERALQRGLIAADAQPSDAELSALIFQPGFSTADTVTELAGRGVGMDVVRSEVTAMGGRIETQSAAGAGTRFKLLLPLTTAVTQVVMLRCGEMQIAVPSTLIEVVRRVPTPEVEAAYTSGTLAYNGEDVPFFWLAALLAGPALGEAPGRNQTVVVIRSAAQRVAVHVDEVIGNQEVVVKNVGSQLSRLPGLAGVTLLPSGAAALIYNPVALASLFGDATRERARDNARAGVLAATQMAAAAEASALASSRTPMVLVVDDSLTVRRVTQRLLVREGYRVVLAKDGLEALERLAEERPVVLLSDIEMPRMDGFDLLRNVRADPALAGLPVVMITSRIAQKHRDYAMELGVDHYLGKPYSEEELLSLVARYAGTDILA